MTMTNLNTPSAFSISRLSEATYSSARPYQITLSRGQTFRLPRTIRVIEIIDGCAWVSADGRDIVLHVGDQMSLDSRANPVIISAESHTPLSFWVVGSE